MRFLDALAFPLADPLADCEPGQVRAVHADDRGDRDARHRRRARRRDREDGVLDRLQGAWAMVGAATAVLSRRRAAGLAAVLAALIVWDAWAGVLPNVGLWPDVLIAALHRPPGHLRGAVARAPRRPQPGGRRARGDPRRSRCALLSRRIRLAVQRHEAPRPDRGRVPLRPGLRGALVGGSDRRHHPVGRRALGLARADELRRLGEAEPVRAHLDRVPASRRERLGEHRAARHPLLRAVPGGGRPASA